MAIKKKLIASIFAAVMASSAMVISVNASVPKTIKSVFQGGTVTASLTLDDAGFNHSVTAYTSYSKPGRVFVALDVDDYITGKLIKRCDREESENWVKVGAIYPYDGSRYSMYSSHEVIVGNNAWGEYMQWINVM